MCFVQRVQEVRRCFYIGHDGERIINISSIERREFTLSSRVSSMWNMKTLPSKGPRGDPIATSSVCSYRAPLNWNSCPLVATLRRSTRSDLVRFKSYVVLNQLFVKALFARSCIVSSNGTLVNREETSYETKMSPFALSNLRISFANQFKNVGYCITI